MSNVHPIKTDEKQTFGQILRSELARLDISQQGLATKLGASRATINNLINNKYDVSSTIARGLAEVFDRPIEFWMKSEYRAEDLIRQEYLENNSKFGRLSNVGIMQMIESKQLKITPFEKDLIQPASIDLRAGKQIKNTAGTKINVADQAYWLSPGETILVETKEEISLPANVAGNIGGMGRHVKKFINYGIGYEIDPGFEGILGFTITNMGDAPFRVHEGMPIITVMFYLLTEQSSDPWVNQNYVETQKPHAIQKNSLEESIMDAFDEAYQETERQGTIEYSIAKTGLRFQTKNKISNEQQFSMFLSEILAIQLEVDAIKGSSEDALLGQQHDEIWRFLDEIKVSSSSINASNSKLKPLLEECDERLVAAWFDRISNVNRVQEKSIGDHAHMLGTSSLKIVLTVFNRLPHGIKEGKTEEE